MAQNVTINGVVYAFPETGESNWGDVVTQWAVAVSSGLLQKSGGSFILTADVDFGTNFGIKTEYIKDNAATIASAGFIRLSNNNTTGDMNWRNAADSQDLKLYVDSNDNLIFDQNGTLIDLSSTAAGNVNGPGSSTDNAIVRFDGTSGQLIQDSGIIVDDSDNVTGINDLTAAGDVESVNVVASGKIIGTQGADSTLSIGLSGGTLSFNTYDGTTPSASNPGYVWMGSDSTPGENVRIGVTAQIQLNDDNNASSNLGGSTFGITSSADWSQDLPFFIYAINKDDTAIDGTDGNSAFAICKTPFLTSTPPLSTSLGDYATVANQHEEMFLLGTYTLADYVDKPCKLIGVIRMQWSSGTTDWTIQTLGDDDGIGEHFIRKAFSKTYTFPTGQNGAASGTYILPIVGTAPVFSSNLYKYQFVEGGLMKIMMHTTGDGGTDGSGAEVAGFVAPMPINQQLYYVPCGLVAAPGITTTGTQAIAHKNGTGGVTYNLYYWTAAGSSQPFELNTTVNLDDFTAGNRVVDVNLLFSMV